MRQSTVRGPEPDVDDAPAETRTALAASRASSSSLLTHEPVRQTFTERLPSRPIATDDFELGAFRRPLDEALLNRYIEFNPVGRIGWFNFDIDREDAFESWEDASLPAPNIFMQNRDNGRGHLAYALASPVGLIGNSRPEPIAYAADIQRGMTLRLRADPHFSNRLSKNPYHNDWRVTWFAIKPYNFFDLRGWLDDSDVWRPKTPELTFGLGRNSMLFDEVRYYAYRKISTYRAIGSYVVWLEHLRTLAFQFNGSFVAPLPISEVRGVAKSVAQWTWHKFGAVDFSAKQSVLGRLGAETRWEGHESLDYLKPWKSEGISRATYFRRKKLHLSSDLR